MDANTRKLTDEEIKGILEFPCSVERLDNGNTLIADAGSESGRGSEVIEVDPTGNVVWSYSEGQRFTHTAKRLKSGTTIVADTSNDRIFEVDNSGRILFSSDDWGAGKGTLSNGEHLLYPNNIFVLDENRFMVTNRNSNRFDILDRNGHVEFTSSGDFKHPHNCEPLANGNYIIADSDQDKVREIDKQGKTVWEYNKDLEWPRDANRLDNGNTLITDSKNSRIIEVTPAGDIAWEYKVDHFANFYEAIRLKNGNTLISDQQHKQVIEVSPDHKIVWTFRNFKRDQPVYEKMTNGFFKKKDENDMPADWTIATRFSEGGGKFVWGENDYGKKVIPGLEFDRSGALCCQQTIAVTPGTRYTMGGSISTEELEGFACFQVAFSDEMGGLLCDVTKAPKGESFSGNTEWTQDTFDLIVPNGASTADVRVFITGKGRVFFKELRFFS